ncbi:hypothetical protein INT47_011503, partial [Mucor saturninus]
MSVVDAPITISPSQKNQIKAWWKKVKLNNPNFQDLKMSAVDGRGVFGISLLESVGYAHSRISYVDDKTGNQCNGYIPIIIAKCGAYLKDGALSTEGIFRLSGNAKRISMLQTIFDSPHDEYGLQLDWSGYTVHDASNVMRRFLNYLPEPVITLQYQAAFTKALHADTNVEEKIEAFQALIEQLPILHQYLLLYLLDLLCLFSLYSENTRMDLSSLATAFSPAILSDPNDAMNPSRYKEAQKVLEFLIEHQTKFSMPRTLKSNDDPSCKRIVVYSHHSRSQQELRRHNSMDIELNKSHPYSPASSHSVSDLSTTARVASSNTVISLPMMHPTLKRSKTVPSKREKHPVYDEPQQMVILNNSSNAS